jgi:hypothetical protein
MTVINNNFFIIATHPNSVHLHPQSQASRPKWVRLVISPLAIKNTVFLNVFAGSYPFHYPRSFKSVDPIPFAVAI